MNSDIILRGTANNDSFRFSAVISTKTVQKMRDLHDLSPIATILMGRMLSAVAMLSWELKHPDAEITLRVDSKGDLSGGVAICSSKGYLRGYASNPKLFYESSAENFMLGKALGKGTISLLRNDVNTKTYTGTCELVSGEIGEDLAYYFLQSEQIPSAVNLGILLDKDAIIRAAGGFIIQQLPFADTEIANKIYQNIQNTPNISDLMDMGLSMQDILSRFVFKDIQWQINETKEISFKCSCTRERFVSALMLLGKQELQSMQDGIKPVCNYCNTEYHFNHDDMQTLIKQIEDK
ncbi:MAG: Hsp33 family molecular chaperone HslO [Candidatus Cloacimonetes bacterium]|nr:Hsp33 family molecular chaperone HslO [Candidatus Cloacimonadota bacterium]